MRSALLYTSRKAGAPPLEPARQGPDPFLKMGPGPARRGRATVYFVTARHHLKRTIVFGAVNDAARRCAVAFGHH